MIGHTPGPWQWIGQGVLIADDGNAEIDLTLCWRDNADGRLIETAPELLRALRRLSPGLIGNACRWADRMTARGS